MQKINTLIEFVSDVCKIADSKDIFKDFLNDNDEDKAKIQRYINCNFENVKLLEGFNKGLIFSNCEFNDCDIEFIINNENNNFINCTLDYEEI